MPKKKKQKSRGAEINHERAERSGLLEAKLVQDKALELIPFVGTRRAQKCQTKLYAICAGLYKGLVKPTRQLCKSQLKSQIEGEPKYIDKSQFDVFGAGRVVLDTLGVERVILCGASIGNSFILEFAEPGPHKTIVLPNVAITITGKSNFSDDNELNLENAALCIYIYAATPKSMGLWFSSEVRVAEIGAAPDKFIALRGIDLVLDQEDPTGVCGDTLDATRIVLSGLATGFPNAPNMSIQSQYRLNNFGAKIPITQSDLDCIAAEEWKRLFKNAEEAQKAGWLRTAKSLYHKTLTLAEKLDYEYQCKSLIAIKRTIIEIVSKEKAISLALADEAKALFDKAIKLRDASASNHSLGQKYTVPIYQLHTLMDVARHSLKKIPNLKDEVANMDYQKDIQ